MGQYWSRVTGVVVPRSCNAIIDYRRYEQIGGNGYQLEQGSRTSRSTPRSGAARNINVQSGVDGDDIDEQSVEEDAEEEFEGPEFDIPEDAYGGAILAIVQYVPKFVAGESRAFNLCVSVMALGLLFTNLLLQVAILAYVDCYVVQPAVRRVQLAYQDFRRNVFNADGAFEEDEWVAYDRKEQLCEIALTDRVFYYSILFCWTMSVVREMRISEKFVRDIKSMPYVSEPGAMVIASDGDSKTFIVGLTTSTRVLLNLSVCAPKILISVLLLWLGCQWLSATTSFTDLVMNAVAMEFVLTIDNTLYDAFLPQWYREEVADVNFKLMKRDEDESDEAIERQKWTGMKRSMYYCVAAIGFIVVYAEFVQDVLPSNLQEVKAPCKVYVDDELRRSVCAASSWSLRSLTKIAECYPYGEHDAEI